MTLVIEAGWRGSSSLRAYSVSPLFPSTTIAANSGSAPRGEPDHSDSNVPHVSHARNVSENSSRRDGARAPCDALPLAL